MNSHLKASALNKVAQDVQNIKYFLNHMEKIVQQSILEKKQEELINSNKPLLEEVRDLPFNRNIFKMGYIIAIRKTKDEKFGKLIEARQLLAKYKPEDAEYTHVEISGGGYRSMMIAPPRARAIMINEFYKGRYIKVFRHLDPLFESKLRYKIAYEYAMLCNKKYDKLGIISFAFSFIKQNANLYFCSEGVCKAYQHYLSDAFKRIDPNDCFPATIISDPYLELVWEGIVK